MANGASCIAVACFELEDVHDKFYSKDSFCAKHVCSLLGFSPDLCLDATVQSPLPKSEDSCTDFSLYRSWLLISCHQALEDLVLAMRLNLELCDASHPVEQLDYRHR